MPAPAPYVPGQTGTLGDVLEHGPELQQFTPAGPNGFAPAPSWTQMFTAARPAALQGTPLYDNAKSIQGWAPIIDALGLPPSENPGYFGQLDAAAEARFGSAGNMVSNLATKAKQGETLFGNVYMADRPLQESLVLAEIRARRANEPNFLPGVPDDPAQIHPYLEQQQAAKRAAGAELLSRGSTFGRVTAGFAAGGVESALNDPLFLPSMVLGGGTASGVIQAVGRDALINGVLTAANQPVLAHNMAENNEHLTLGEAATNVVEGAVVGGVFGGAVHGARGLADLAATHVPPALFQAMPESVQTRWADRMRVGEGKSAPLLKDVLGDMDNRELSSFARTAIGPHMTPDETAAANVLERTQEIGAASPFMSGPAGDGAHNANVAASLKAILDGTPERPPVSAAMLSSTSLTPSIAGAPVSTANARVPGDIVDFFKSKGLDDAHAYGIAAGIVAESGGREGAVNPQSGAFGLGQLLGSRKAALLERYGPNPSRAQQLEHLWGELTGGDPGGKFVLQAKDAGAVLDAYIRKFMRPHAGFETSRDLAAGMEALGHKGELPEAATGVSVADDGDADLTGALQRDAEQADAEALDAQRSQAEPATRSAAADITPADMPILKRELFPNDGEWAEAQLALVDRLTARDGPQSPGNGPPGSAEGLAAPEVGSTGAGAPLAQAGHLQAFDVGGSGRDEQIASLEHDLRMQAREDTARAAASVLRKYQSDGALPRSPHSLLDFIASRGGIEDVNGDLKAMGVDRWHRLQPFRRKLLRERPPHAEPGIAVSEKHSPEKLFEAAIDNDYFPELNRTRLEGGKYQDLPDLSSFYEAIDEEMRGRPRYSIADQEALFDRARAQRSDGELGAHIDNLQALAEERGIALDEGAIEHAIDGIAAGASAEEALHTAVEAAAMRDLAEAVADTGDMRYGVDANGRRWDDEVNYAEHRDPAADDQPSRASGGRSQAQAADAAPGRTIAGEHEGAPGEAGGLEEKRYQLAPDGEPQTLRKILDDLDREAAAVKALRACAGPGGEA